MHNGGFTIIEAVMVLAVASLIFMIVFVAIPQLQKAQRDNTRKSEMQRLDNAIAEFQSNNYGRPPEVKLDEGTNEIESEVVPEYMGGNFADPIGGDYNVVDGDGSSVDYESATMVYRKERLCDDSSSAGFIPQGASSRSYAIIYELEQDGARCRDNS